MALRLPISLLAEFRGIAPSSEFTNGDGQRVEVPPKYKFEVELGEAGDDVDLMVLSERQLERASCDFPLATLRRGERVRITGVVNLQDRGSDRDSYLSIGLVAKVPEPAAPKAGASGSVAASKAS